jgi:hypothetical protein
MRPASHSIRPRRGAGDRSSATVIIAGSLYEAKRGYFEVLQRRVSRLSGLSMGLRLLGI